MRRRVLVLAAAVIPACGGGAGGGGSPAPPLPGVPGSVALVWSSGQVQISWAAVASATRVSAFRATNYSGPYGLVGTPSASPFLDTGLVNGLTYYYYLRAGNDAGDGPPTTEFWGVPGPVPLAPASLVAAAGTMQVDLTWASVAGATAYRIDHGSSPGGPYERSQPVPSPATAFTCTGLAPGVARYFRVRALTGSALGPPSPEATAVPGAPAAPPGAPAFNQARGFSGGVTAFAAVPDGSGDVYVAGTFLSYGSQPAHRVVRMNPDFTLDPVFSPAGVLPPILCLAVAADGSGDLFAGGVGGVFRFDPDGTLKSGFSCPVTGTIRALHPLDGGSGDVLVAGTLTPPFDAGVARINPDGSRDASFTPPQILGSLIYVDMVPVPDGSGDVYMATLGNVFRMNRDGSEDWSFTPVSGGVDTLAVAGDGSDDLYIGGNFQIRRVNRFGAREEGFVPQLTLPLVYAIVPANDGTGDLYVGGGINASGMLVRLRADGSLDPGFDVEVDWPVGALMVAPGPSRDLYAGGGFRSWNGSGVGALARVNGDGTLDAATRLGAGFNDDVTVVALAADGSNDVYVGGDFRRYDGRSTQVLARLKENGTLDETFVHDARSVAGIVPDASGQVYVAGTFGSGVTAYRGVRRLNANGSRDATFNPGAFDGPIYALARAADGDLYVGGAFTTVNGAPVPRIVRLDPAGTIDATFAPSSGFNGDVEQIVPAADGSGDVYVGGRFTVCNGVSANYVVRLTATGTVDTDFATGSGFNARTTSLSLAADGDLFVGGTFTSYKGSAVGRIVRLDPDGMVDGGFVTGAGIPYGEVTLAAARDGSGDVYVGGDFNAYNGTTASRILRLEATGSIDAGFDVGGGVDGIVRFILPLADGRVYLAGDFSAYRETTVDFLVRAKSNGAVE